MNEEMNATPIKLSGQISFHCTCCGDCCRGVKESIMLESLDAYRLLRYFKKTGSTIGSMEELYEAYSTPMPLNELGYPIFLLNTRGSQQACVFLQNNRCSVYDARPRTCRLYPFTAGPGNGGKGFQYYVCREKPHHFIGGVIQVHDWMHQSNHIKLFRELRNLCRG